MLQVVFKRLCAKNFLSIGEEPLEIEFKIGLNVITGKNYDKPDRTNGVGKSTIVDALHFGLFGSTIRELTKENIVNNITGGKCLVTIEFDIVKGSQIDQYQVYRSINPSKCELIHNGVAITRSGIPQTNELIAEIIKSSPELFQNGVIMTVNNTIPFMSQKKTDKRKFIEGILNLGAFSDMLLLARADYNEVKKAFDVELAKIAEIERGLTTLKALATAFESDKQKKLIDIKQKIVAHQQEIDDLQGKITKIDTPNADLVSEIKVLKAKVEKIVDNIESENKNHAQLSFNIRSKSDKIAELTKKRGICEFCNKNIDQLLLERNTQEQSKLTLEIKESTEHLNKSQNTILELKSLKKKTETDIAILEKRSLEQQLLAKTNEHIANKIEQIQKWIKLLKDNEQEVINSKPNFDKDLVDLTNRHQDATKVIKDHKNRIEIIDAAKFVVSEEGVKSILVKKILKILNAKLAHYLKKMEANCIITFNEYFEETITNEKGKTCVYHNFSGAERKAIDLACLFAFMDIRRLQGDLSINISMYDELLDSSMDEKGVDLVLDILKERVDKHNESVYIISHRRESVKHVTGDIIFIEKRDGISRRAQFDSN